MKIILSIPGEQHTVPMGGFTVKALQQLGHKVIVFNHDHSGLFESAFNKLSHQGLIDHKNNKLMDLIEKEKPDLFFSIYGRPHPAIFIEKIKAKGILTVCWWLNDPFKLPFEEMDAAPAYDYVFSNSAGAKDIYRKNGVKNIHFLPVGIDQDVHKDLHIENKKYDIVLAGDHHPVREKAVEFLINKGFNVAVLGPWKRKISKDSVIMPHLVHNRVFSPQQMVEAYNDAKIVFNIHTWIDRFDYGVNPRLFEASGCGAFQVSDNKAEISLFFTDKKDIVLYPSLEALPEILTYYLSHDEERKAIAAAAFITSQKHTYINRMKELLAVCNKG
jgi:spore maturation protein CgeB